MTNTVIKRSQLLKLIEPVLNDMPAGALRHALFEAFWAQEDALVDIEDAFARLTSRRHSPAVLRKFFASWSKTNNSAASVSGLANRITLLARSDEGSAPAAACNASPMKIWARWVIPCTRTCSTPWPPRCAVMTNGY